MVQRASRFGLVVLAQLAVLASAGCGSSSDSSGSGATSSNGGSGATGGAVTLAGGTGGALATGGSSAGATSSAGSSQGGTSAGGGGANGGSGGAGVAGSGGAGGMGPPAVWDSSLRQRATDSMVPLQTWYSEDTGLWNKTDWWTSANQLETLIDYTREVGDPKYNDDIDNTFTKNSGNDFDQFGFYDDDGWWALAWIKAYDLSHQQKYLDMAKTIFKRMSGGWDTKCGGGIYWASAKAGSDGLKNKNAIPNSLFLTTAARLHERTPGDSGAGSFLDWAQREWAWFKGTGMITADNQVVDGLNNLTDCKPDGPIFTYNQGSLIGGLVELSLSNGDASALAAANAIAHATISKMADPNGILIEAPCGGDICVQFKGVFMRNLAYLNRVHPLPEYRAYMKLQSDNLWNANRNMSNDEYGYEWQKAFDNTPTASRQSSALDALVAAVRSNEPNLALVGASASATNATPCSDAEGPSMAIDGSVRTDSKWCAGGAGDQTLSVDLGATRSIVGFRVQHAGAGGENSAWNTKDFEIETSTDGQTWTRAVTVTGNTSDITTHPVNPISASKVRLHVTNAQTATDFVAARIYELEIFGTSL